VKPKSREISLQRFNILCGIVMEINAKDVDQQQIWNSTTYSISRRVAAIPPKIYNSCVVIVTRRYMLTIGNRKEIRATPNQRTTNQLVGARGWLLSWLVAAQRALHTNRTRGAPAAKHTSTPKKAQGRRVQANRTASQQTNTSTRAPAPNKPANKGYAAQTCAARHMTPALRRDTRSNAPPGEAPKNESPKIEVGPVDHYSAEKKGRFGDVWFGELLIDHLL
jgi:hypothetical protein